MVLECDALNAAEEPLHHMNHSIRHSADDTRVTGRFCEKHLEFLDSSEKCHRMISMVISQSKVHLLTCAATCSSFQILYLSSKLVSNGLLIGQSDDCEDDEINRVRFY